MHGGEALTRRPRRPTVRWSRGSRRPARRREQHRASVAPRHRAGRVRRGRRGPTISSGSRVASRRIVSRSRRSGRNTGLSTSWSAPDATSSSWTVGTISRRAPRRRGARLTTGTTRAGSTPAPMQSRRTRSSEWMPFGPGVPTTTTTSASEMDVRARRLRSSTSIDPVADSPSMSSSTSAMTSVKAWRSASRPARREEGRSAVQSRCRRRPSSSRYRRSAMSKVRARTASIDGDPVR